MNYTDEQLEEFIDNNRSRCEIMADEFFAGDVYQAAEYLIDQI